MEKKIEKRLPHGEKLSKMAPTRRKKIAKGPHKEKNVAKRPPHGENVAKRPPYNGKKILDFPGGGGRAPTLAPPCGRPCRVTNTTIYD